MTISFFWFGDLVKAGSTEDYIFKYGGDSYETANNMLLLGDGRILVGGKSSSFNTPQLSGENCFLAMINETEIEWMKIYGNTGTDNCYTSLLLESTEDNGFLFGGLTTSFSADQDMLIFKVTNNGTLEWTRNIGSSGTDVAHSISVLGDGNILVAGFSHGYWDPYFAKIDQNGVKVFIKTIGIDGGASVEHVISTNDGLSFVLCGATELGGVPDKNIFVAKFDNNGVLDWYLTIGNEHGDRGAFIYEVTGGDFIICGKSEWYGVGSYYSTIMRISSSGSLIWAKLLIGISFSCSSVTEDENFILASGNDKRILKFNSTGNLVNVLQFSNYISYSIEISKTILKDGNFYISGYINGQSDCMFAKINEKDECGFLNPDDSGITVVDIFPNISFSNPSIETKESDKFNDLDFYEMEVTNHVDFLKKDIGALFWTVIPEKLTIIEGGNIIMKVEAFSFCDEIVYSIVNDTRFSISPQGMVENSAYLSPRAYQIMVKATTVKGEITTTLSLVVLEIPLKYCYGYYENQTDFVCSGNGVCVENNTCCCSSDYGGDECNIPRCFGYLEGDQNVCSGHGSCINPDECICNNSSFYGGDNCEYFTCFGKLLIDRNVCNGSGICISPQNCSCTKGYTGDGCGFITCFGISEMNVEEVCSGNGLCTEINKCKCKDGYSGEMCDDIECFGKKSSEKDVCSSHGDCNEVNNCSCSEGFGGERCELFLCNKKLSNNSKVCSGHGKCLDVDDCWCSNEWSGSFCNAPHYFNIDPLIFWGFGVGSIVGLCVFFLILISCLLIIFCQYIGNVMRLRKIRNNLKNPLKKSTTTEIDSEQETLQETPRIIELKEVEKELAIEEDGLQLGFVQIDKSEILLKKKIGDGGFGTCYLASWTGSLGGGIEVVVKKIELTSKTTIKSVYKEIQFHLNLKSPAVCLVYGFSLVSPEEIYIIMEKMDFDLSKYVALLKPTMKEKVILLKKMTQCIYVLHKNSIIHRDLKCANFLADKSGKVKITDFGISIVMKHSKTHVTSMGKGTIPWMAPELFQEKSKFSFESDIYALGCCFFEVLFEKIPFSGIYFNQLMPIKASKKLPDELKSPPKNVPKKYIDLMRRCLHGDPKKRPDSSNLLHDFSQ